MSSVYGFENLYNERVNDIALENYNKGIAHRLRMNEQQMQANLPFKEPKMLGGVRASNSIKPGASVDETPRAVGGRASRKFTGEETPAEGGKINRYKKSQKWTGYAKDTIGDAFDIAKMAGMGGKINRYKKSQKWTGYAKDTIGDAFDIAKMAGMGGKLSRIKKAQKWTGYAKDTVGDAIGLAKMAAMVGLGKGMVYSKSLRKAIDSDSCSDSESDKEGGAKPKKKRTGRFVKGSAEAKAWGQKMKEARMKK